MLKTESQASAARPEDRTVRQGGVVVIWIDWYSYHVARFAGLAAHPALAGRVTGIELVNGVGVHAGLRFREALPDDLPVQTLFPGRAWAEVKGWRAARAVWRALRRLDPAAVLVPGYYTAAGLAAALWGRLHGRRTVLMTESTEADHARSFVKEKVKGWLIRLLFERAVAGGTPHRRYLQRLGYRRDRIGGFYDVVDNGYFGECAGALRRHSRAADFDLPSRYFLYVGRLAEEKNINGLLAAYFDYRRGGGSWPLVIVGDGPERPALELLAAQSRYSRDILFSGMMSTAELPPYYAFAGCFVLPSTREPWGLVANEAMAAGLPLIVSQRCGCAEDLLVEGENGCAFDPSIAGDLAACLGAVAGLDDVLLRDMGQRSQEIVARFSPASFAAEVARIVKD